MSLSLQQQEKKAIKRRTNRKHAQVHTTNTGTSRQPNSVCG